MLLPSLYNAPITFYALIFGAEEPLQLEQHDHYLKQTYRNRSRILGGNGVMDLVIPVVHNHGKKLLLKDVRMDFDMPWNKVHWKSISAAYRSSPFYEYYQEELESIYRNPGKYLVEFNTRLLEWTLEQLEISRKYAFTKDYLFMDSEVDFRELIHPKRSFSHPTLKVTYPVYQQVFSDRHGFIPDLSVLDLLFNTGAEARSYLGKVLTPPA